MPGLRVGVLVSGRGSNLQSLIDAFSSEDSPVEIVCVVSNQAGAFALERAAKAGIKTETISHRDYGSRDEFDAALDRALQFHKLDLLCLAGFMRILTKGFVEKWHNRLVNIHPSLLPAFPGLNTHQRAIESGAKFAGCTVHFVRSEVDSGPIIIQAAVPIHPNDDADSLAARVLAQEHAVYPHALRLIASGELKIDGDRTMPAESRQIDAVLINPPLS